MRTAWRCGHRRRWTRSRPRQARPGHHISDRGAERRWIRWRTEIRKLHADLLAAHDADGDGSLSLEEFESLWREATRTVTVRAFQSLDTDDDAIVTGTEYDRLLADGRDRRHKRHMREF